MTVDVVVGAILDEDGRLLMALRHPKGSRPHLWELPGGRVEEGEEHVEALRRELAEELGVVAHVFPRRLDRVTLEVEHDYTLHLYRARIDDGHPRPIAGVAIEWIDLEDAIVHRPLVPSTYLFYKALREMIASFMAGAR